jgi:hypothetical protein
VENGRPEDFRERRVAIFTPRQRGISTRALIFINGSGRNASEGGLMSFFGNRTK